MTTGLLAIVNVSGCFGPASLSTLPVPVGAAAQPHRTGLGFRRHMLSPGLSSTFQGVLTPISLSALPEHGCAAA
jgi:hypothetical protein